MNSKFMSRLNQIEEKLLVFSFGISVIVIAVQVVMRSVFNASLSWSEELARYLFVWQSWIGVSFCQRFGQHISIDFLKNSLKNEKKYILETGSMILSIGAACVLCCTGFDLTVRVYELGSISTALHVPMWLIYGAMPTGCVLYIIRAVLQLVYGLRRRSPAADEAEKERKET